MLDEDDLYRWVLGPFLAIMACFLASLGGVMAIQGVLRDDEARMFAGLKEIVRAPLIWFAWETFDRAVDAGRAWAIRKILGQHEAEESEG